MAGAAVGAFMLPGDVYSGDAQVFDPATGHVSDDAITRSADLAGLVTLGAGAIPAETAALRSGIAARKIPQLPMDEASRLARAKEMGFRLDRPVYKGMNRSVDAFDSMGCVRPSQAKRDRPSGRWWTRRHHTRGAGDNPR